MSNPNEDDKPPAPAWRLTDLRTLGACASITGPWEEQTTLTAAEATLSWTIPQPAGGSQRFYRVLVPAQLTVGAELLAGASVAQTVVLDLPNETIDLEVWNATP